MIQLLGYNCKLYVADNVLVALYCCLELACFLDLRNTYSLLVNLDSCGCESLGNLGCRY